jgi:phosphoribosylformylglycinamidine cyclo-ligase
MVPLIQQEKIKALAHITGGGILENIPRVLPNNVVAKLDASTWTLPPVLQWLIVELGNMDTKEALRTFNCGIGMVVFVDQTEAEFVLNYLRTDGNEPTAQIIGSIVARNGEEEQVIVTNVETMFAKTAL